MEEAQGRNIGKRLGNRESRLGDEVVARAGKLEKVTLLVEWLGCSYSVKSINGGKYSIGRFNGWIGVRSYHRW
jgi:hypothetical protein